MGVISKSYARATGILASICLVFGGCIAVVSFVITSKASDSARDENGNKVDTRAYWWSGLAYLVPGILGIIVGVTRKSGFMIAYLVFTILSVIGASLMIFGISYALSVWSNLCENIGGARCGSDYWESMRILLILLLVFWTLCGLFAFISSIVSCSSFCNMEPDNVGIVIHQAPTNTIFVQQQNVIPYNAQHPNNVMVPPPYTAHQMSEMPHDGVDTKETAKLMENQDY